MALESPVWALGLMSGTSMDGVDAALIRTDGERVFDLGPNLFRPYSPADVALLRAALTDAKGMSDRNARPGVLGQAEALITDQHISIVQELAAIAAGQGISVDLVGFHGQTVFHDPAHGVTVQIGDGFRLARETGIRTVYDFRAADVAAGGQGAPLVPVYHRAIAEARGLNLPIAILNIGGVANVTIIDRDSLVAFDTGPGNALINDVVFRETAQAFDDEGKIAATGRVDETFLGQLMADPFFALAPPKSLDRNAFSAAPVAPLAFAERVATLTAFTAESISHALRPTDVTTIVVAGGGAKNRTLLDMLAARSGRKVIPADKIGLSGDFIEAEAFAYLAARRIAGLPSSFPTTTRAPHPVIGGVIAG